MRLNHEPIHRFANYEFDSERKSLRKNGIRMKLQPMAARILIALLEHPGQVVSRKQLRTLLWKNGRQADLDHGLNTAVKKLRIALCDDAMDPRYVETVIGSGYRFIGTLEGAHARNGFGRSSLAQAPRGSEVRPIQSP